MVFYLSRFRGTIFLINGIMWGFILGADERKRYLDLDKWELSRDDKELRRRPLSAQRQTRKKNPEKDSFFC